MSICTCTFALISNMALSIGRFHILHGDIHCTGTCTKLENLLLPLQHSVIPYSAKFSRRIIFAFYTDRSATAKRRGNRVSLIRENVFPRNASNYTIRENCAPRKFGTILYIHVLY